MQFKWNVDGFITQDDIIKKSVGLRLRELKSGGVQLSICDANYWSELETPNICWIDGTLHLNGCPNRQFIVCTDDEIKVTEYSATCSGRLKLHLHPSDFQARLKGNIYVKMVQVRDWERVWIRLCDCLGNSCASGSDILTFNTDGTISRFPCNPSLVTVAADGMILMA